MVNIDHLRYILGLGVFLFLCPVLTVGQLSPGELAEVHAHLEGLSKCTQCHVLGSKVSNDKCLDCHDVIADLVASERGYHAAPSVKSQDCFACHSDHHGRGFDMIRFDEDQFDHGLTGYELSGAHDRIDCRSCHQADFIEDVDIRSNQDTYLGLSQECASCHDDFHQGTLSNDCASCHDFESFRPAPGFDHQTTAFPLTNKHVEVACVECHRSEVVSGSEMQLFADTEFSTCASCHDDVHNGRFGVNCAECHNTVGFEVIGGSGFDHGRTGFPLRGSHRPLECASCHQADSNNETAYQDFAHLDAVNCINCHDDVHESRFGTDCRQCHNEVSFQDVALSDEFDHALTNFPLDGRHADVTCSDCHIGAMTDALPHEACMDCHTDFHNGQFESPECRECHNVEGFSPSDYSFERHAAAGFPLLGAHMATPCLDCHLSEEQWVFSGMEVTCVGCHGDVHAGVLDTAYYPGQECTACHSEASWSRVAFDHSVTEFDLVGMHLSVKCAECHTSDNLPSELVFREIQSACHECHMGSHGQQFDEDGVTRCEACHHPAGWLELTFVHDSTEFKLDGAHAQVACTACHTRGATSAGVETTIYRSTPIECVACHK